MLQRDQNTTRDKECHCILIKVSIHHKDIKNAEMYTPNNRGSKDMGQKSIELKEQINKPMRVIKDF